MYMYTRIYMYVCTCIYMYLCLTATVGFNQTMYDISEQDSAKVCVVVLQGKLTEDVSLQLDTYNGSAEGEPCSCTCSFSA